MAPKITFSAPASSELLVFDAAGSAILGATALKDLAYTVLPARGEVLYFAPSVLLRMAARLGDIDWSRKLSSQLYKIHLLACLDVIAPKAVVTWIDNSWLFHSVSRAYKGASFYAMQNGNRSVGCVTTNPPLQVPGGYVTSMPDLLCFGPYEEELYRSHGHTIDRFHHAGSLIGGWYRFSHPAPSGPPQYDLCLVSQWRADIMSSDVLPPVKNTVNWLAENLSRYAKERGAKVLVATRASGEDEAVFYRRWFGPDVALRVRREGEVVPLSTYEALDEASVAVGFCSTALLEAFGWGQKTLFCNVYRDKDSYEARPGPWRVDEPSYGQLRDKLDALRAMTPAQWEAASAEFRRYAMAFDPAKPAHLRLRELVERGLSVV